MSDQKGNKVKGKKAAASGSTGEAEAVNSDAVNLEAVADALAAAADAVEGSESETEDLTDMPAGLVGRAVYRTCYCVSYGVVFPSALLAGVMPKDNAIWHGFADGKNAARDAVDAMRENRAARAAEPAGATDVAGEVAPA